MAYVEVDVAHQLLRLSEGPGTPALWVVGIATAKNGVGEQYGSYQTPRGRHVIRAKIGAHAPRNGVFVGRRLTGEIYSPALRQTYPQRDWILTRILWLSGLDVGKNRMGAVDTMRRYIYVHGAPDEDTMGVPSSHGCVKMHNDDILRLFDSVEVGTQVHIIA
ncbi:MAG: L,D-transpeptidase family protein [Acidiferrobacter sp.]